MKHIFSCLVITLLFWSNLFAANLNARINKKNMIISLSSLPKTIDPIKLALAEHFLILQCVSQTLVKVNENGYLEGDLAKSWSISNDGKTYEFKLYQDVKTHTGKKNYCARRTIFFC
jgi:peptide/nickel transport system substrate-binding protein